MTESENIRERLNIAFNKTAGTTGYIYCPKFTKKPNFYKEMMDFLNDDLTSIFKVQCDSTLVGLHYALKERYDNDD